MVTNGMWETQGKVARLPEEDPQTFQSFLDWALSGIYRTREMARDERDDNWGKRSETGNLTYFLCEGCRKSGCFKTDVRTIIQCPACDAEASLSVPAHGARKLLPTHSKTRWVATQMATTTSLNLGLVYVGCHPWTTTSRISLSGRVMVWALTITQKWNSTLIMLCPELCHRIFWWPMWRCSFLRRSI